MSPHSVNYRGRDTTEFEVPRCHLSLPSAASAAPVALSSSLRYHESGRDSPSSVALSATASRRPCSRPVRSWIGSGPVLRRPPRAGSGLRRRSTAKGTGRSLSRGIRARPPKYTASSMRRWSAPYPRDCSWIISAASIGAVGPITWSPSRSPRINGGDSPLAPHGCGSVARRALSARGPSGSMREGSEDGTRRSVRPLVSENRGAAPFAATGALANEMAGSVMSAGCRLIRARRARVTAARSSIMWCRLRSVERSGIQAMCASPTTDVTGQREPGPESSAAWSTIQAAAREMWWRSDGKLVALA